MSLPVFGLTAAFLVVMAVPLAVPLHLPGNLLLLNGAVMFAMVGQFRLPAFPPTKRNT